MKKIQLTRGKYALVNDEDFEYLNQWKWNASPSCRGNTWYAIRTDRTNGKTTLRMHRVLMNCNKEQVCDHVDFDGLNNQKENLRLCTTTENNQNRRGYSKRCTSNFKGVNWHRRAKSWQSSIGINCGKLHIGYFKEELDAALAYDEKAKELYKEFACLNFSST